MQKTNEKNKIKVIEREVNLCVWGGGVTFHLLLDQDESLLSGEQK